MFFLKTSLFLIISLYVSAYDLFFSFFFFREEQQQVFLRFNVTPSANFLVCSKCVTGDSQQDRNARAYFLVKQENKQKNSDRVTNKTLQNINQTEKKTKNSKQNYARSKRSDSRVVQIETAHHGRYVFKLLSCLTVIIVDRTFILFFSTVESVMFTEQKKINT